MTRNTVVYENARQVREHLTGSQNLLCERRPDMSDLTACSVQGCERDIHVRGLCRSHYGEWWKAQRADHMPICSVAGCEQRVFVGSLKQGLCPLHYSRVRSKGEPGQTESKYVPRTPEHRGYLRAHDHLREVRGPASDYPCVDCGKQAMDWSYVGDDLSSFAWSDDLDDYQPKCKPCHARHDWDVRRRSSLLY